MFLQYTHFIVGSCIELIGLGHAMNTYAGLPVCAYGPWGAACTTSMLGDAYELSAHPGKCWLPVHATDPYYDSYWCQPVTVDGVQVTTPCTQTFVTTQTAPCEYRQEFAILDCPDWAMDPNGLWGVACEREVVTCP